MSSRQTDDSPGTGRCLCGDALRLLAIGEVMAEIKTKGDEGFALGFAGDSYNTAVYAAREIRVPGAVAYLTRVGQRAAFRGFCETGC